MTLLLVMNLGFGWSGIAGPAFKVQWAVNRNQVLGPAVTQAVQK